MARTKKPRKPETPAPAPEPAVRKLTRAEVFLWWHAIVRELESFDGFLGGPRCPDMTPEEGRAFGTAVGRMLDLADNSDRPFAPRLADLRHITHPDPGAD